MTSLITDLSQSLQGAGGIGGLIASVDNAGNVRYYLYDANGNVGQLVTPEGDIVAHYEYDPFGNAIVAAGSEAGSNVFRFSTKYFDVETGLYYYGFRYYLPEVGRWIRRDPIEETGSILLRIIATNSENFINLSTDFQIYYDFITKCFLYDDPTYIEGDLNIYVFVNNNILNLIDHLGLSSDNIEIPEWILSLPECDPCGYQECVAACYSIACGVKTCRRQDLVFGSYRNHCFCDIGLTGSDFEQWLKDKVGGEGPFKNGGREFDGKSGNRWFEAKSGRYWKDHAQPGRGFDKFKSDIGAHARIAKDNGAQLEIHSNGPIPEHVKNWLSSKKIPFFEY